MIFNFVEYKSNYRLLIIDALMVYEKYLEELPSSMNTCLISISRALEDYPVYVVPSTSAGFNQRTTQAQRNQK